MKPNPFDAPKVGRRTRSFWDLRLTALEWVVVVGVIVVLALVFLPLFGIHWAE